MNVWTLGSKLYGSVSCVVYDCAMCIHDVLTFPSVAITGTRRPLLAHPDRLHSVMADSCSRPAPGPSGLSTGSRIVVPARLDQQAGPSPP